MEGLRRDSHILDASWITDKKLLHFKLSKSGQTLCVDKTCFPRPGHNFSYTKNEYLYYSLVFVHGHHVYMCMYNSAQDSLQYNLLCVQII